VSLYNRLRGRHHHYLLAHHLRKNHTTIWEKRAPAITMMTSLSIHCSNHRPQSHKGLERNLSSRCNHQRKTKNDQQRKSPSQRRQMKKQTQLQIKKSRTSLQIREKKENRKSWRLKK
jgi:hypothetical protein